MNAKTLADFRVDHGAVLECLLVDSFTALVRAGVASLDRVAQDGVRVRASAGAASFRRHSTLQECAAPREDHQPGAYGACQSSQAGEAAAMIEFAEFEEFRYSEPQWAEIKAVVRDARLDVDEIRRTMEFAASVYLPQMTINRQRRNRGELKVLRRDVKNLRARIRGALAVHIKSKNGGPHRFPQPGVDDDLLDATTAYFARLVDTLDRQIEKAETRTRRDNARKTERDEFWTTLLVLWCDIGGQPHGLAAARFLIAASKPVGADATIKTVSQWLQRRKETVSKLIADLTPRSLRLSDDELFGFWRATARMGYPTSPLHRLRLLTGMRLNVRVLASDRADGLPDRRAAAQLSCSEVHGDTIQRRAGRSRASAARHRRRLRSSSVRG
jgi:hypothetical protein